MMKLVLAAIAGSVAMSLYLQYRNSTVTTGVTT